MDNLIDHIDNVIVYCKAEVMHVIRTSQTRRSETPGGVMTTLASPTQGGAERSIWRVEVKPGVAGPVHAIDREQVWTFLRGGATVDVAGDQVSLAEGDTVVIPASVPRQLEASEDGFTAIVTGAGDSRATTPEGKDFGVPNWIA